jgi:hypothetical protein
MLNTERGVYVCVTLHRLNLTLCVSLNASHTWPIQNSGEISSSASDTKLTDGQPDNTTDTVFLDRRFMELWLYVVQ